MINVIFCGYRSWAFDIINSVYNHKNVKTIDIIRSKSEYNDKIDKIIIKTDIIVFIGWSWIIPNDIIEKKLCLGLHPSNLPEYRGGSPLQHQIINGLDRTKISLMSLSKNIDSGDIWLKRDLSLAGDSISDVFLELAEVSTKLLNEFFDTYPKITPVKQDTSRGKYYKRRKPVESKLTAEDFSKKKLSELYNFIRALTSPYPNAYMEDTEGNKLLFTGVKYISKKKST